MPRNLSYWINRHEYPPLFLQFPFLLNLQWLTTRLLYHRGWLIQWSVNRAARYFSSNFTFLDAGCGAGDFLVPAASHFLHGQFKGVDASATNIKVLENYCRRKNLNNVQVECSVLEKYSPVKTYDCVLCASVLQYLSNRFDFLISMGRIMNSGGQLIIYVPVNYHRRIPGYRWLRESVLHQADYESGKEVCLDIDSETLFKEVNQSGLRIAGHRYLYGPAGQIAYELTSLAVLAIQKTPWLISMFIAFVYSFGIHPFVLLLQGIDLFGGYKSGNGLLIRAIKE